MHSMVPVFKALTGQVEEASQTVLHSKLPFQFVLLLKAKRHQSLVVNCYCTSNKSYDLSVRSISSKQTTAFSAFILMECSLIIM